MNRRRVLLVTLALLALTLILAAPALAAAGGGSAGFGGGGGGGGGGRGAGLYILVQILIRVAIFGHGLGVLVILGVVVLYVIFARVSPGARRAWSAQKQGSRAARRTVAQRSRRVELAAAEAAEDDPAFAPDRVRAAAGTLFEAVQAAWTRRDRHALAHLVGPELMREWTRRLDDLERRGWHNHVELLSAPKVEYVGLNRGSGPNAGQVVVRIEAELRDYVTDRSGNHLTRAGRISERVQTREFWTLRRRAGSEGWVLLSIELGAEGSHALQDEIVATPWADEQALRDEALVEGAAEAAVPKGTDIAELASLDFDGDARAQALDLSLADGRFAPDILAVSARRAVSAWAQAIDGDAKALKALCGPGVVGELLHPGDPSGASRLVVRGPRVRQIHVAALDPAAKPPTMTVELVLEGRRYIEDRDTTRVIAGDPNRAVTFHERWTFALTDDPAEPWRIVAVGGPPPARR